MAEGVSREETTHTRCNDIIRCHCSIHPFIDNNDVINDNTAEREGMAIAMAGFVWKTVMLSSVVVLAGCAGNINATQSVPQDFTSLAKFYGPQLNEVLYKVNAGQIEGFAYTESPPLTMAMTIYAQMNHVSLPRGITGGTMLGLRAQQLESLSLPSPDALGGQTEVTASRMTQGYGVSIHNLDSQPFLTFYKIIPARQAVKMTIADYFPDLKIARDLEVLAHAGTLVSPDSLAFYGKFLSPALADTHLHEGLAPVAGVGALRCYPAVVVSWSESQWCPMPLHGADDVEIGVVTLPKDGALAIKDVGAVVYVNTGRPLLNKYMTVQIFKQVFGQDIPQDWFAVFNMRFKGQIDIATYYRGEFRIFTEQTVSRPNFGP